MSESLWEYRTETTHGHRWVEEEKDWVFYEALLVRWRDKGSRKPWHKVTIVPQNGQTIEGLRAKMPEIVETLAARETE